ncbi:MAG: metal-dependent transcriptional regulator [Clostridia bacterium]|nr:metal-dependent transcriptional regulator [Clostridia bacterium]
MNTYAKYHQSEEDYLESILLIGQKQSVVHRIDVARDLGVSGAAVNKAIKILIEKGYVFEEGKHLRLTENGERYARAVFEKHCIIRDFLRSLGVSEQNAEEDACRMEHLLSEETVSAMKSRLS